VTGTRQSPEFLVLDGGPDKEAFRPRSRCLRRALPLPGAARAGPDALAIKLEIAVAAELGRLTYAPALAAPAQDARRPAS
jgi:hypothetical protein